jgi:hypothetical protein
MIFLFLFFKFVFCSFGFTKLFFFGTRFLFYFFGIRFFFVGLVDQRKDAHLGSKAGPVLPFLKGLFLEQKCNLHRAGRRILGKV